MKILVTGATGFVGSNLIKYLSEKGYQTICLNRLDLINPSIEQFTGIQVVIHLAGKAHDLKNVSSSDEYYDVNVKLTKKLYSLFLTSKATKFIFISSVKAAADTIEGVLTEEYFPNPQTHYGKSKLEAENYLNSQSLPECKRLYILRPCMIHGPGNKGNLNLLYRVVKYKIPYPFASFMNLRSFTSIRNFCFIIHQLLLKNIESGVYNVADDRPIATIDVFSILSSTMNVKPKLWSIPKNIIYKLARVGDILKLPFNSERLQKLTESYVVSNLKLKTAINNQLPFSTEEGLRITANSFRL